MTERAATTRRPLMSHKSWGEVLNQTVRIILIAAIGPFIIMILYGLVTTLPQKLPNNNLVRVEKEKRCFEGSCEIINRVLFITSLSDDLEIQNIVLNRGQCAKFSIQNLDGSYSQPPVRLKFSERIMIVTGFTPENWKQATYSGVGIDQRCNNTLIEAIIYTNRGYSTVVFPSADADISVGVNHLP
jgi:hypothetical protein